MGFLGVCFKVKGGGGGDGGGGTTSCLKLVRIILDKFKFGT